MNKFLRFAALAVLAINWLSVHAADQTFKPFVLASTSDGNLETVTGQVIDQLKGAGFDLVGQYAPMDDTQILVVTSQALLDAAKATDRGAYGAAQRVSISTTPDGIEVGFVNPVYLQHAYRMDSDLGSVQERLKEALGFERFCGAGDKQMTARKLAKYHYMVTMPYFDDPYELGEFASHEAALAAVLEGLERPGDGLSFVYRIDIPGTEQSVIGIGMRQTSEEEEHIDESYQMGIVDFEGCRKRAYLPYEVLVDGKNVEALHMKFRMAVHFPNLSMAGKHGFTKLMPFPGAIEDALEAMLSAD